MQMSDSIQLWQISLAVSEPTVDRYWQHLSEDEKAKANRFRFAKDKRRFVVARGVLRTLLATQFAQSPSQVQFCYGEYGKPKLSRSGEACDFHFNLSHSQELALCVLGKKRTVGVDVEYLKGIKRLDGMMERCLTPMELAEVRSHSESQHLEAFLQRWTCKEAYLKAIGLGLTQSMQSVEVKLSPPSLTTVPQTCAEGWHLSVIDVPDDYVAALVVAGTSDVEMHRWQHS